MTVRSTPYPAPPSLTWAGVMTATYGVLALAGALVLAALVLIPQAAEGLLVLGLWGVLTLVSSLACLWGVIRSRYRWEWIGSWGIVMGTSIYLVVTAMGTLSGDPVAAFASMPTLLWFVYGIGLTLGRAIQLSLIDLQARRQVLIEKAVTGEVPEVASDA